ncbi:TPA: PIG-L deacetylase family protein [Escherichia coli]
MINTTTLFGKKTGVLAIGAHPDDIELGCGASLSSLAHRNIYVVSVVMTSGSCGAENADRHKESQKALKILGCDKSIHLNFEDTRLYLQIREMISSLENIIATEIPSDVEIIRAYTMHDADRHQDHIAVYQASMVACRYIPQILGYETPSTWLSFAPQVFESIDEIHFNKKILALQEHRSQNQRKYMQPEYLLAQAKFRGQQVNHPMCEGFVVHKMVL